MCRLCTKRPLSAPLAGRTGVVYVLHFDRPVVVRPGYTAGHYVGWTLRLNHRLHAHRCGIATASVVTKRAREQGVSFTVAGVCSGTTEDEQRTRYHGICGDCGDRLTSPAMVRAIERSERRGGGDAEARG